MKKNHQQGVILIGHGGVPKNYPRKDLTRLKTLESTHPKIEFQYLWPFDMKQVAILFASRLSRLKP